MMDSFHKKSNASFFSDKDSPKKNTFSPGETGNSNSGAKKGFISSLFTKKKAAEAEPVVQPQQNQATRFRSAPKQKLINRKNVSDGHIKLNVADADRVPEDYVIDYKDNPYDVLDLNPSRTTSYIENLRSREFSEVNNREVQRFVESQQQKSAQLILHSENLELDLLELSKSFDGFTNKFFRFFQALLPGFCLLHLMVLFYTGDNQVVLENYALFTLRMNQVFQVIALLSTVGAFKQYIQNRERFHEVVRSQPLLKESFQSQINKNFITALSFLIVYGLIIFNHEFVAKTSDKDVVVADDVTAEFSVFRILSVAMAIFSVIGWFTLVLASEESNKFQIDPINYSDLTIDEDLNSGRRSE